MNQYSIVKSYPPIRVWGTVGFIVALWVISLLKFETTPLQFYVAATASFLLGFYAFTLPGCRPMGKGHRPDLASALGLNAFALFKNRKMAWFFIFAMLLGASLQLTNAYGDTFLHDFAKYPLFEKLIAVKYPAIIMSISQISETLFILTIPFFLRRYGIKKVMLMSMIAWVLRFGLFAYGNPADGLWMIVLSCIIYGMAFDFFNISGSIFVETQSIPAIRASAQGLFMMMTNGFGAFLGSRISGFVIDKYYTLKFFDLQKLADYFHTTPQVKWIDELIKNQQIILLDSGLLKEPVQVIQWGKVWIAFAAYALVVTILFAILFKHEHDPNDVENLRH